MPLDEKQTETVKKKLLQQLDAQVKNLPEDQKKQAQVLKQQIEKANPKELEDFLKRAQQMQAAAPGATAVGAGGECLFCQIIKGKVETVKIYEDSYVLAILDIMPASRGHMLVIPREHYRFIQEIPDAVLNKLFYFVKVISPILVDITKAKGLNLSIAQGLLAGQRIGHFAINLIPRYEDDNLNFEWQRQKQDKNEIEKLAKQIRKQAENKVTIHIKEEKQKQEKVKKKVEESEAQKMLRHLKKRVP